MKTMVFIDFQNFNISMHNYYKNNPQLNEPEITYPKLSQEIVKKIAVSNNVLVKTFLFAYKPCDDLFKLDFYKKYYDWLSGLKNKPYFEVVEGSQEIRQKVKSIPINIDDPTTFYTEEKGTDVNLAVHLLSKAYNSAYDVAVLVSGDTDYLSAIKEVYRLGKVVVLATLSKQNISKYKNFYDQHIIITDQLLQSCKAT